jgi:hypothetical protein
MNDHAPGPKLSITIAIVASALFALWALHADPDPPPCLQIGHLTIAGRCD